MDSTIGSIQTITQVIVCRNIKVDTHADGDAIRHEEYRQSQ